MTVVLENLIIPERGVLELNVNQSIEIKVTAEEARRKVNRWLLDYVSYMMHADPPTFVVDGAGADKDNVDVLPNHCLACC